MDGGNVGVVELIPGGLPLEPLRSGEARIVPGVRRLADVLNHRGQIVPFGELFRDKSFFRYAQSLLPLMGGDWGYRISWVGAPLGFLRVPVKASPGGNKIHGGERILFLETR